MAVLGRFFFIWGTKKVITGRIRQVVILYSNNCMGIGLDGLSIVVLNEWSSYRGGHLSRFDCTENYLDTKKLTVSQKISLTWSISLHVTKMSQNPPQVLNLFIHLSFIFSDKEKVFKKHTC